MHLAQHCRKTTDLRKAAPKRPKFLEFKIHVKAKNTGQKHQCTIDWFNSTIFLTVRSSPKDVASNNANATNSAKRLAATTMPDAEPFGLSARLPDVDQQTHTQLPHSGASHKRESSEQRDIASKNIWTPGSVDRSSFGLFFLSRLKATKPTDRQASEILPCRGRPSKAETTVTAFLFLFCSLNNMKQGIHRRGGATCFDIKGGMMGKRFVCSESSVLTYTCFCLCIHWADFRKGLQMWLLTHTWG